MVQYELVLSFELPLVLFEHLEAEVGEIAAGILVDIGDQYLFEEID